MWTSPLAIERMCHGQNMVCQAYSYGMLWPWLLVITGYNWLFLWDCCCYNWL